MSKANVIEMRWFVDQLKIYNIPFECESFKTFSTDLMKTIKISSYITCEKKSHNLWRGSATIVLKLHGSGPYYHLEILAGGNKKVITKQANLKISTLYNIRNFLVNKEDKRILDIPFDDDIQEVFLTNKGG